MTADYAFSYPYLVATTMPLKNSVTAVAKAAAEDTYQVRALFYDGEEFDTERGTIAHKILENYEFGKDFYGQIERIKSEGILSDEQLAKVNLEKIRAALSGGAFDKIRGKTLYREQDFIVNVPAKNISGANSDEEILVQGVIDLLAVDADGAEVIDYKYSSHDKETLKRTYSKQLDLYAYAVERALGLKVKSKTIVNIFTGETVKVD